MPALNLDTIDDALLFEAMQSFAGGEDNYRNSTLIDPDQCQKLVNIIVRDNYEAATRPGADPFADSYANAPIRALLYFDTPSAKSLVAVCARQLIGLTGKNGAWAAAPTALLLENTGSSAGALLAEGGGKLQTEASDLTIGNGPSLAWTAQFEDTLVELAQGVDTVLISDGNGPLAILDANGTVTICGQDPQSDPPIGATILCWHTGRMFATGFGDNRDTIWVSNRLAFGTGEWNATTRSFRIGSGDGDPITALRSLQGFVLAVFKANSLWLVQTNPTVEPDNFQASTVVESVGFGVGCVGKRAVASVANDVFFMAQDGVRSLQRMQSAAGQWQLSAPISQPVQRYIDRINWACAAGIVAMAYKEFVLFSVPLDISQVNNATLVYNTRLGRWLGCWTGWTPTVFAKARFGGIEQLLFGDSAGVVSVWKDGADLNNALTYRDNGRAIATALWTRSFQFGELMNTKTGYNATVRFTGGAAPLEISAVLELENERVVRTAVTTPGSVLGVDRLPFTLASLRPYKLQIGLRSLPAFNEMYLRVESASGWFRLRSVTLAAFANALQG